MGRPAFTRFLVPPGRSAATGNSGVRIGADFASWDDLLDRGRDRARLLGEQRAFVVDPSAGMQALVSLFAVASVPDTTLIWATPTALGTHGTGCRELGTGLYEVDSPVPGSTDRPLWGVGTSGSSGTPKIAIGHADLWELVALHYERAVFGGGPEQALATCLPLQFSAAFFMAVLPGMFLRRDLVIYPAHDWSPVVALAAHRDVVVLGVPAIAAAACLGMPEPVDLRRATLLLGGGHLSAQRVELIRDRFAGAEVVNLYGTAETGAIALDHSPGHNRHVGHPINGKAVWIQDPNAEGIGMVAAAGPDCCRYLWRPGEGLTANAGHVASTDYGRFDEHGRLCLAGRVDGAEKVRGVLVYPRTIERHLLALDGVADARVLVRTASSGLEHLVARVVGRASEDELRAHCADLSEVERPSRFECIPETEALAAYGPNGKL